MSGKAPDHEHEPDARLDSHEAVGSPEAADPGDAAGCDDSVGSNDTVDSDDSYDSVDDGGLIAEQDAFDAFIGVERKPGARPPATGTSVRKSGKKTKAKGKRPVAGADRARPQSKGDIPTASPAATGRSVNRWLWAAVVALLAVMLAAGGLLWWRSRPTGPTGGVGLDAGRPPTQAPYQKWKLNPGCPDCRLAADDTSVFVAFPDNRVAAYDLVTGNEKWSASLPFAPRQILVRSRTVLVGTGPSDKVRTAAVDPSTGRVRWEREGLLRPPTEAAIDAVLMETAPGDISTTHLVDLAGGQERWRTPGAPWAVCGDLAVVGDDTTVRAVGMGDGRERWKAPVPATSNVGCTGTVVAALADRYAVTFTRAEGRELWRRDIQTSALTATGDLVLMGGQELVAVDAATGADRWTAPAGDFLLSARVEGDKLVVFGMGASLRNRADGQPLATLEGDSPEVPSVVATPGGLLHREGADRVTLRSPDTFETLWTFTSVGGVRTMTAGGGRLVVLDTSGDLVGYG